MPFTTPYSLSTIADGSVPCGDGRGSKKRLSLMISRAYVGLTVVSALQKREWNIKCSAPWCMLCTVSTLVGRVSDPSAGRCEPSCDAISQANDVVQSCACTTSTDVP